MSSMHPEPALQGRRSERAALERLLEDVRVHQSRVLVLRGEAGVGKTALLEHLMANASGCRIACAAGVQGDLLPRRAARHHGQHQDQINAELLAFLLGSPGTSRRDDRKLAAAAPAR